MVLLIWLYCCIFLAIGFSIRAAILYLLGKWRNRKSKGDNMNWRDQWEEKDVYGNTVTEVVLWSSGTPACYRYESKHGDGASSISISSITDNLIPRRKSGVVYAWKPDEVPVGAVIRDISLGTKHVILGRMVEEEGVFFDIGGYGAASPAVMRDSFVMHQPDVKTADCPPCGKVVES